jgi:pyrrolidone-carboxylate peptidase
MIYQYMNPMLYCKLKKDLSQQRHKVWDVHKEEVPTNLAEAEKLLKQAVETVKEVLFHTRVIRAAHLKERTEAAEGRVLDKK